LRVYIASPYIKQEKINNEIERLLTDAGISVFLPKSLNVDAITEKEKCDVAARCYKEIDKCDAMIIVHPFGLSVAAEIGYAVAERLHNGCKRKLILFLQDKTDKERYHNMKHEVMTSPYMDYETDSLYDLLAYVKGSL